MNYTKKLFLVDEDRFKKLRLLQPDKMPDDVAVQKYTTKFFQDKVQKLTQDDSQWTKLGSRLTPILQSSFQSASQAATPTSQAQQAASPQTPSPQQPLSSTLEEEFKSMLDQKILGKSLKLLNLVINLPGVGISNDRLVVNGSVMPGLAVDIVEDLIRARKTMTYSINPLLEVMHRQVPDAHLYLGNKAAKHFLQTLEPPTPATPTPDVVRPSALSPYSRVALPPAPSASPTPLTSTPAPNPPTSTPALDPLETPVVSYTPRDEGRLARHLSFSNENLAPPPNNLAGYQVPVNPDLASIVDAAIPTIIGANARPSPPVPAAPLSTPRQVSVRPKYKTPPVLRTPPRTPASAAPSEDRTPTPRQVTVQKKGTRGSRRSRDSRRHSSPSTSHEPRSSSRGTPDKPPKKGYHSYFFNL